MATKYPYQREISHAELNKSRRIKAASMKELLEKVEEQEAKWDAEYERVLEREERERQRQDAANACAYAEKSSQKAEEIQLALDNILLNSLSPVALTPNDLKDFSKYRHPRPKHPKLSQVPQEPQRSDEKYNPVPSFFTRLSKKKMEEFNSAHTANFEKDHEAWATQKETIEKDNAALLAEHEVSLKQWEEQRDAFKQAQAEGNQKIDLIFEKYPLGDTDAVEHYFTFTLERTALPFTFHKEVEIEYDAAAKAMIVEMLFPVIDDIPKLKSVSYVKAKKEFKETLHSEAYLKKKYDSVIYQMVLQALNYIFTLSKEYSLVDSVVINGKIHTIDKATGKNIEPCILSVSVARSAFEEINLSAVDPKAWFKSTKGVSAASLANVTPVAPIVAMNREDKRFIEGYSVVEGLDDSINLAAIDWQDFENLIREIFEKEFNVNGGEVKITQASRDGGVDAVAFDPDPIRGGKIVIQAKRYTNIVGVSAVRDLYGTVMNEGATKGILVTTSNYGNDAYSFAQGKPLTLMNGANLLYLLEKHGYKARIDLKEAKEILK